ncbi:hypothetical protein [Sabulibacter ruber]|uniref:hypothetical protein n=1 Tax=Sabulibacter ruber TaxID=2811901 RepID=UPI001F60DE61|nr:hypothetical protein [Sabulibacter ruber]
MTSTYNRILSLLLCLVLLGACSSARQETTAKPTLDALAERYVKTLMQLGQYDADIVDAYYGPEEWKPTQPKRDTLPAAEFLREFRTIQQSLAQMETARFSALDKKRVAMFQKQVVAAITKVEMMQGKKLPFDEEAQLLYDATPPHYAFSHFDSLLHSLNQELPGQGDLAQRWATYQKQFVIPKEKLNVVFKAAINEARKRTIAHYPLPANENFTVEYVTNKPWSGYNYFKGNGYSLIQINTDFPIQIERAIDLACHEGYPGHHVFNALLEQELVKKRGWKEFSIYPLFSPQSLIAEGSANYGIQVAFPAQERLQFEKEVLFTLAGLNPTGAERYYAILEKIGQLNFAGNEIARHYLNGHISREQAADLLVKYNFYQKDKALQRTRFMDRYRSYVINYNLGQELVRKHVEALGGTPDQPEKRWEVFRELLSNPYTASMLQK